MPSPTKRPSDEEIAALYHWINVPRIAATFFAAAVIVVFWAVGDIGFDPKPLIFILIPAYVAATIVVVSLVKRRITPWALLFVQQFVDLAVISGGVYFTGALHSPFLPLFLLVVVSSGLISREATVGFAAAIMCIIGGFALAGGIGPGESISVVFFLVIVGLIAFQSQYYVASVRRKDDELLKLKDDFLFRTIHDIRSPSTIIQLILSKYEDPVFLAKFPEFKKDSAMAAGALSRIGNLVEELLKIARGEGSGIVLKPETIDLPRFMSALLAEYRPAMEKKRIALAYAPPDAPREVIADAEKLKEALANFIDNAIKYNKDGGEIRVKIGAEGKRGFVGIADTGIGISEKSLPKIFAPYFRGDVGRDIPGTGLGMYYSKMLIEKMGGAVSVMSVKGDGTTFTIALPAAEKTG